MSNITDLFNPPPSRDLSEKEVENCFYCQAMATITAFGAGVYFGTGRVFKNEKPGVNPLWWKKSVKLTGVGLIGYGIYRFGENWLWNKPNRD
ncbi:hypothetical protein DASC09_019970 [Saccharomycopsis crataegensis]|uniref:DUF4536 domain-containing protein n=1 Tax=Saccharomycopsis crataegensis TaxID=43959 RepID=A0AAV5QJD5_9ASCO|nr:hypothetical protein DASC09_019970 [Saccharomycopsis crataegensis]